MFRPEGLRVAPGEQSYVSRVLSPNQFADKDVRHAMACSETSDMQVVAKSEGSDEDGLTRFANAIAAANLRQRLCRRHDRPDLSGCLKARAEPYARWTMLAKASRPIHFH